MRHRRWGVNHKLRQDLRESCLAITQYNPLDFYFPELLISFFNCSRLGDTKQKKIQEQNTPPCNPSAPTSRAPRAAAMTLPPCHGCRERVMFASSWAPAPAIPGKTRPPEAPGPAAPTGTPMGRQEGQRKLPRTRRSREAAPCPSCGTSCSGCTRACPTSWSSVSNSSCSTSLVE